MKKTFQRALACLNTVQCFYSNISNIGSGGSAIPALSQVASSMFALAQHMTDQAMEPLVTELQDLLMNNGPQAKFYRRLHMHTADEAVITSHIASMYPKQYPDADKPGLKTVIQGLIPNLSSNEGCYASKYGPNTVDVRPTDEALIDLIKNWNQAASGSVMFDDGVVGIMMPAPAYSTNDTTRAMVVELVSNENKSRVTFIYASHSTNVSGAAGVEPMSFSASTIRNAEYNNLRSLLTNNFPNGMSYFNVNWGNDKRPLLQFDCEVYNRFEDMSYPATSDFITHYMVRQLFENFLWANHVPTNQKEHEHLLDPKLRYERLIPLLHEHAHPGEVPLMTQDDMAWRSENTERNYSDPDFYEAHIVDDVKDPTKRLGFAIVHNHQTTVPSGNRPAAHVITLRFDDEEKTCQLMVYSHTHRKFVDPTPLMAGYLIDEVFSRRATWIPEERERQEEAARNKAAYEERENKRIKAAQDARDAGL
jgi:hypothetical protein